MGDTGNQRGTLADDFATLLNSGFDADITLHAGSFKMLAHKTVLIARSPFFATILKGGKPNCHLELHDVEPDVLLQLVIFMYTDRVPKLQSMAQKLLSAAEKLKLPGLEQKCKDQLALNTSREKMFGSTLHKHQKRSSAVLDNTQTLQVHTTEISQNTLQVAAEKSSPKKMKLDSCVQTSGNTSTVQIATSTIPVQSAEGSRVINGTSSKLNVQTTNKDSCLKVKSPPVPVHTTNSRSCLIQSPKVLLHAIDAGSYLNVRSPKVPIPRLHKGPHLNKKSSKVVVQASDDRLCLQGFMAVLRLQPIDQATHLNEKSPKILPRTVNERSDLNCQAPTVPVQPTDEGSSANGKSPTVSLCVTDGSHLNGKSVTVPEQAIVEKPHVNKKNKRKTKLEVKTSEESVCVNENLPLIPEVILKVESPKTPVTVPVQPTDEGSCANGKSPTVSVCVTDGSHLNGKSLTVPEQAIVEKPHVNKKKKRKTKPEVKTSEESVCVNENSPLIPEVTLKVKSPKTPVISAKHKLSVKGATFKSRYSTGGINTRHSLHSAAECGSLEDVEKFLAEGIDVDTKDKKKRTALLLAAENGHESVVQCLLQEGADVDAQDQDNWTPVHWATHNGHDEVVRCLLVAGADVTIRNRWKSTPLHSAAAWGHVNIIHMLLSNSADINAKDKDGNTPLHCAAKWCQMEVAKVLLQAGADKKPKDKKGKMPLDMVRKQKQSQWAEILT